jgi:HK97 family phage portal protein
MGVIRNIIDQAIGPRSGVKSQVPSRAYAAMLTGKGWEDYTRWDKRRLIEQGFERNAPFYAAASLIAKTVASVPIYVETTQNGRITKSYDHDLIRMLGRNMPLDQLLQLTSLWLITTGESYTNIVMSDFAKRPLALVPLPSQHTNPVQGNYLKPIAGYKYREDSEIFFDYDEVIYIHTPNLREYWHGMSAGVPLAELMDMHNAAITWNKNIALAGGVPPMVATLPGASPEEANRVKDAWQAQSGAANSHRLKIISENMVINRFSDKPQEAEWKEAIVLSMRMIMMGLGVSSALLNDGENMTYSNYETARKALYTENAIPMLEMILAAFTRSLQPYYGDNPKLCIDRDAIEAIQEDRTAKTRALVELVRARVITPMQAAEELGHTYDEAWFKDNNVSAVPPATIRNNEFNTNTDDAI